MKFQPNNKYTTIAIYAFLVLVAAMVAGILLGNLSSAFGWVGRLTGFIQPVVFGFVFAFLFNPILRFFDDRLLVRASGGRMTAKTRRVLGIVLTYIVALLLIVLFIALVIPQLVVSIRTLTGNIATYIKYLSNLYGDMNSFLANLGLAEPGAEGDIVTYLMGKLVGSLEGLVEMAYEYLEQSIIPIITGAGRLTAGLVNLLLGLVISIYILMDREKLFAQLNKITCAIFPKPVYQLLKDIAQDSNRILSGFVIGKVIDSFIISIICFIGMSILGLPYAVLISVIIGVTNIIPYFGPIIGAIPSGFIILVDNPVQAIWFVIFVLLLQQFDGNILGPKILGDTIGLGPLWVVFSILLFSGLFGILGMFIGVPLFAILYSLVKRFVAFLLARKGEPVTTRDYDSERNPLIK